MSGETRLWVDYTVVGHAREFTTSVFRDERERLTVGQTVIVEGDSVPDCLATVVAIEPDGVRVRLWKDHHGRPYEPQPCPQCGHDDRWHWIHSPEMRCAHPGCDCVVPL